MAEEEQETRPFLGGAREKLDGGEPTRQGLLFQDDFASKSASFQHSTVESILGTAMRRAFIQILGESGERAASFYLRPEDFRSPRDLENGIRLLFGDGAFVLEREILREYCRSLGVPFQERTLRHLGFSGSLEEEMPSVETRSKRSTKGGISSGP